VIQLIKKYIIVIFAGLLVSGYALAQTEIQTAAQFFEQVAQKYAVSDFVADIGYSNESGDQSGTLYYKEPNMLRINFTNPEGRVLNSDGTRITVYFPSLRVALMSPLRRGDLGLTDTVTPEGLYLMQENYSISYLETRNPVPLEEGSDEMVIKLRLTPRSSREGFRQLDISVGTNGYIRRIIGLNQEYREIQIDFYNIRTNQNIPDAFFDYDPPPEANVLNNFLGIESE
jgi:chaperone LolA